MKKELEIVFRSTEESDNYLIDRVLIELSESDIESIKKANEFIRTTEGVNYVALDFKGDFTLKEDNGEEYEDWNTDIQYLKVFSDSYIYFYAQCKYHAGDQIESEGFSI